MKTLEQLKSLPEEERQKLESILVQKRFAEKKPKSVANEEEGSGKIKINFGSLKPDKAAQK